MLKSAPVVLLFLGNVTNFHFTILLLFPYIDIFGKNYYTSYERKSFFVLKNNTGCSAGLNNGIWSYFMLYFGTQEERRTKEDV